MATRNYREHENYVFLINTTRRLLKYLLGRPVHPPGIMLMNEISFIVTLARSIFGKEVVDEHIRERVQRQDTIDAAVAAGICTECFKEPALPKRQICETCLRELVDENVSDIIEYKT